jgi:hypothetical protein
MQTEVIYKCEICGEKSTDIEQIKKCEAKGVPNLYELKKYKYVIHQYDNISFCIPVMDAFIKPDSILTEKDSVKDFEGDHFKRMIQYLVSIRKDVKIWDGKNIVDYDYSHLDIIQPEELEGGDYIILDGDSNGSKERIEVTITSYVGISGDAEHYYDVQKKGFYSYDNIEIIKDDLMRELTDIKEVEHLNRKDNRNGGRCWEIGSKTQRFNSIAEIKTEVEKQYPKADIIYDSFGNEEIVERNGQTKFKKTGQKIQITDFRGFSSNFKNLEVSGSIHEVIEEPIKYKHQKLTNEGYWVMGVYEPALVLTRECELIEE